jgi:hypothetical protein
VTVHVKTGATVYVARVFVPETRKRFSDVLCDERAFLLLTDVSVDDSEVVEPFIAVNKRSITAVRVLHDGDKAVSLPEHYLSVAPQSQSLSYAAPIRWRGSRL